MSSVTVCNCPQNTPDPACLWAVSSRPSDQQQKRPDGRHTENNYDYIQRLLSLSPSFVLLLLSLLSLLLLLFLLFKYNISYYYYYYYYYTNLIALSFKTVHSKLKSALTIHQIKSYR